MSNEQHAATTGPLDRFPRIGGFIFLFVGLVFGFIGFYFPIHDALIGADHVTKSLKAIFATTIFTLLGLALIVLGPIATRLSYKFMALKGWQQKLFLAALLIPLLAAGFLVDFIFDQYLATLGYNF